MSGIISDKEAEAFEAEEMARHYKEGPCGIPDCYYCDRLRYEEEYFRDMEYFEDLELRYDLERRRKKMRKAELVEKIRAMGTVVYFEGTQHGNSIGFKFTPEEFAKEAKVYAGIMAKYSLDHLIASSDLYSGSVEITIAEE